MYSTYIFAGCLPSGEFVLFTWDVLLLSINFSVQNQHGYTISVLNSVFTYLSVTNKLNSNLLV